MQTPSVYEIEVKGRINERDFNTKSPLQVSVTRMDADSTLCTICTDQSGVIGLIRHLHGRGFVILSLHRITFSDDESITRR